MGAGAVNWGLSSKAPKPLWIVPAPHASRTSRHTARLHPGQKRPAATFTRM